MKEKIKGALDFMQGQIGVETTTAAPAIENPVIGYPTVAISDEDRCVEITRDIVTLCGSLRYINIIREVARNLTCKGYIVFDVIPIINNNEELTEAISNNEYDKLKEELFSIHCDKILMSDFIYVVNQDRYIGEDTQREIDFAIEHDIPVKYHESLIPEVGDYIRYYLRDLLADTEKTYNVKYLYEIIGVGLDDNDEEIIVFKPLSSKEMRTIKVSFLDYKVCDLDSDQKSVHTSLLQKYVYEKCTDDELKLIREYIGNYK